MIYEEMGTLWHDMGVKHVNVLASLIMDGICTTISKKLGKRHLKIQSKYL